MFLFLIFALLTHVYWITARIVVMFSVGAGVAGGATAPPSKIFLGKTRAAVLKKRSR